MPKFFDEDPDPGSGIFSTLDPGSGINILDPHKTLSCRYASASRWLTSYEILNIAMTMMFCICFFRQKKPSGIVKRDFAGKWGTTKPGSFILPFYF
jgi:hypothetical protein